MNIITHLQKRLEDILDNEKEVPNQEILLAQQNFEVETDPRMLRGLAESLPTEAADKAVILFSRLALYFDSGIFLEMDRGLWEPQAQFLKGHVSVLKIAQKKKIALPQTDLTSCLRTPSAPLLKKLNLEKLDPQNKTNCLFLRPGEDFAFLLFSSLPDLWLKDHAKMVNNAIHRGLYNE